jgi:hypothetical protein
MVRRLMSVDRSRYDSQLALLCLAIASKVLGTMNCFKLKSL